LKNIIKSSKQSELTMESEEDDSELLLSERIEEVLGESPYESPISVKDLVQAEYSSGPVNSLQEYLNCLQAIPLLKATEEIRLARTYRQNILNKNSKKSLILAMEARNKLIESNLRLVVSMAKKYLTPKVQMLELLQEGNLGLIKAAERFDPELGYRFSTYATWWIKQAILVAISEKNRLIRLPVSISELIVKLRKLREVMPKELGREPSLDELSKVLDLPLVRLKNILAYEEQQDHPISLDSASQSGSGASSYGDLNEVPLLETIFNELDHSFDFQIDFEIFNKFLLDSIENLLTEREAMIIRQRYDLDSYGRESTLAELSNVLSISLERVRQIELKALSKLKTCFALQFGEKSINVI
jgi:RNA polymerase sigma factor (sigma-70 family)